jgi:pimeloyl-ACP methyl ester carboxylesterase
MSERQRLAAKAEFAAAFSADRAPDFACAELGTWVRVADQLVEQGELELGGFAVRRLHEAWPDFPWARNVAGLLDLMPTADPLEPPFRDRFAATHQTVARPGATTVVVVFCDYKHRIGMPLSMLHRWLSGWPVSLIYLRDPKNLAYLSGIDALGPGMAATLAELRREIDALRAKRVVCYGHSIGGYGALRYGLELGAEAVVLMAGLANLKPSFNVGLNYGGAAKRIQAMFPREPLDLRRRHQASARPPRTWMVYAEHNWDDRLHAEHMSGLRDLSLFQVDGSESHNVAADLMRAGTFDSLIDQALGRRSS